MAATVATLVMQFSYWSLVQGIAVGTSGRSSTGGLGLLSLGLALAPFVFMAAAWVSRHRGAPLAVLKAMGLFVVVGASLGLVLVWLPGGAVPAVCGAFAAGATVTMRRDEDEPLRPRVIAVAAAVVWVAVLTGLALVAAPIGAFAVMSGAVLPFAAVAFADEAVALRAIQREDAA